MLPAREAPTARQFWQALLLAVACSVLFLRGALLPGRALVPHPPELFDVEMAEAQAKGQLDRDEVFRGNVGMTDKYLQSLCWDRVMHDRFRAGELPRWTNDIGGGAPFVPQMAQPWQPINALLFVLPSEQWYGWWYFVHQVLFGVFAYAFLRRLGCQHAAALLGLVAAVLGLWTQCKLHHNVILTAALSLWPMLSAVHELVACGARGRERHRAVAWLGLWTGLSWSTGFVVVALQATYFALAMALLWALQAERGDRLRRLVPVGLGLGLGALLCGANMIPILLAKSESARGTFDAALQSELGLEWDHALAFVWPDLLSWAGDHFYLPAGDGVPFAYATGQPWSQLVLLAHSLRDSDNSAFQSYVETACAIGLVPLGGAFAALFARERRALVLTLAVVALLSFGIATADQPFLALAQVLPGLNAGDLRRQLFLAVMATVVLGALGVDAHLRTGARAPLLALLAAAAVASLAAVFWLWRHDDGASFTHGIATLIAADANHPEVAGKSADAIAAAMTGVSHPGEADHNRAMLAATAWRALLVAGLGIAALWLRAAWRAPVWIALTIAELLHAGLGPVQTVPAARVTALPAVLRPVADASPANGDRPRLCRYVAAGAPAVAALPGNFPGFLHLEDSSAYNPLPPARLEAFMRAIEKDLPRPGTGIGAMHDAASLRHPLCDLFGMRFVLTRETLAPSPGLVDRTPSGTGGFRLYERTTTLPRATFVQQVDVIADEKARLEALGARDRDVAHRVVLEDAGAPVVDASALANAAVTLVERRDERVVVRVRTDAAGYLRLADPWDAGWRATRDGESTPVHVADHFLRAVYVPAGEHEVVFTYDGARAVWPLRLTALAYGIVLALFVTGRRKLS